MKTHTVFLLALVCPVVVGCDTESEVGEEDYDDIAVAMGEMVAQPAASEVVAAGDAVAIAQGEVPPDMAPSGAGSFSGANGSFNYSYSLECFDAAEVALAACDETADRAVAALEWSGALDTARYQWSGSRSGSWTLDDLQTTTPTLNGDSTLSYEVAFTALHRSVQRQRQLEASASYQGLVFDTDVKRFIAGTIIYDVQLQRSGVRGESTRTGTLDAVVTITFDGTDGASMTIDGTRTYTINLANGEVIAGQVEF